MDIEEHERDDLGPDDRVTKLEARVAELEQMLDAKSRFIDELTKAGGYFLGEAVTARGLIARLKDGDR